MNALLIEDDVEFAAQVAQALIARGFEVSFADTLSRAAAELSAKQFDVAVIDLVLPGAAARTGVDVLHHLRRRHPNTLAFMMTVKSDNVTEIVAEAMRLGAKYFFDKRDPRIVEHLIDEVESAMTERRRRVFVSHGHDKLVLLQLKDFLRGRLHQDPLVLAEQPSQGLTVVEKLERASALCSFAVVLLTRDDVQAGGGMRARQNVIHEVGFFQGKYGRKNVVLICEAGLELFSNISGIVRLEFESGRIESIFEALRIELESAGFGRHR